MNIKISQYLFNLLTKYEYTSILFGGRSKGKITGDYDYLHIIPDSQMCVLFPMNNKHLLQYSDKDENNKNVGVDHVFMTLSQFVHSIYTGDNIFIIEVIFSHLKDSEHLSLSSERSQFFADLLSDFILSDFITFNILRGLLGLARRDTTDVTYEVNIIPENHKKFRFIREGMKYFFLLYVQVSSVDTYVNRFNNITKEFNISYTTYDEYNTFKTKLLILFDELRHDITLLDRNNNKVINAYALSKILTKINSYSLINDKDINDELLLVYNG